MLKTSGLVVHVYTNVKRHLFGLESAIEEVVGVSEQLLASFLTQTDFFSQLLALRSNEREVNLRLLLSVSQTNSIGKLVACSEAQNIAQNETRGSFKGRILCSFVECLLTHLQHRRNPRWEAGT